MNVAALDLPGVLLLTPRKFEDARGYFAETYNRRDLEDAGIRLEFVQDNHSYSAVRGTVRGLHFQAPPAATAKLVRVLRGAAFFAAVDLRPADHGRHASLVLDGSTLASLLVPEGVALGFCTLQDHTELLYKVTGHYVPECDAGLRWNDPALGIPWPVREEDATLSDRDRGLPLLAELPPYFGAPRGGGGGS